MIFDFFEWYQNLQGFELILWSIAIFFSVLFILQSIISIFTGGDSGDADSFDGDSYMGHSFFTVRNMIAFFTMFGWTGLAAYKGGLNNWLVVFIALFAGISMVAIMYLLMRNSKRLKASGTLQMKNAINQVGETYLRIPGNRQGLGKVQVQVQGRYIELDAMTDDPEDISTGKPIKVVNILNNRILLVTSNLVVAEV